MCAKLFILVLLICFLAACREEHTPSITPKDVSRIFEREISVCARAALDIEHTVQCAADRTRRATSALGNGNRAYQCITDIALAWNQIAVEVSAGRMTVLAGELAYQEFVQGLGGACTRE
jgi:hypothetical protein